MISLLLKTIGDSAPTVHIAPQALTTIHGFIITNSILYGWACSLLLLIVFIVTAKMMTIKPRGGFIQFVEVGADFITDMLAGSFNDRKKALKYAPYFTSIFFFIMLSNLLGLIPGAGEAITLHGIPALRPFTADLNGTLAAASVSMIMIQVFAIRESGLAKHLRHYFQGSLINPLTYLLGFFEVFGEATRLFSLSLRLFLNIAIGEIIISIFAFLGKLAAPITAFPFVMLEIGVCILQAYIFVVLCTTYLAVSIAHGDEHESDDHEAPLELVMKESN